MRDSYSFIKNEYIQRYLETAEKYLNEITTEGRIAYTYALREQIYVLENLLDVSTEERETIINELYSKIHNTSIVA